MARLIAFLLLLSLLPASMPQHAFARPTASAPKTFMWKVRSKTATVYVLGSIHVATPDVFPLDPRIERAFAASDTLILEAPLDAESMQRGAQSLQRSATYTPPDRLDKHLDPETMKKLEQALGQLGLPAPMFQMLRPWMISMTLSLTQLAKLGYRTDLGIDMHFHKRASSAGEKKQIGALETIEEQVAVMRDMREATQVKMLQQTLDELHLTESLMTKTFAAWKRGDTRELDALLVEPSRRSYPVVHRRLLLDRNVRMANGIKKRLEGKGTVFVVVGSAHLVGKGSVLSLLKKRGFSPVQQ